VRRSQPNPESQAPESVVVTGTRILDNEQFSPPVTAITTRELSRLTPSNLPDGLNKLPIFAPAQTSNSAAGSLNIFSNFASRKDAESGYSN